MNRMGRIEMSDSSIPSFNFEGGGNVPSKFQTPIKSMQ